MAQPSATETRILFVGDMHLGRRLSSLPADLDATALGPRAAWDQVVQAALEHQVHAVALAGDVLDSSNALFEAYGLVQQGLERLNAAGITVCAVAGNHDTEVLPRLAEQLAGFHLLGPGGTWSGLTIQEQGAAPVRLVGWSFPARVHADSPLATPPPDPVAGQVTLGLLHGDLDASSSVYAPVASASLRAVGYDGWFLGHEHKPGPFQDQGHPFYLGSLTPLTPNETGTHGPVLLCVRPSGTPRLSGRRLALAPLRWDHLAVDCSSLAQPDQDLAGHLLKSITEHLARLEQREDDPLGAVKALGLRIELTGEVGRPEALRRAVAGLDPRDLNIPHARFTVFVQRLSDRTTGRLDLVGLARENHPAGILARQILLIQGDTPPGMTAMEAGQERSTLLAEARQAVSAVDQAPQFAPVLDEQDAGPLDDGALVDLLRHTAHQALAHLLAERQEAEHASD